MQTDLVTFFFFWQWNVNVGKQVVGATQNDDNLKRRALAVSHSVQNFFGWRIIDVKISQNVAKPIRHVDRLLALQHTINLIASLRSYTISIIQNSNFVFLGKFFVEQALQLQRIRVHAVVTARKTFNLEMRGKKKPMNKKKRLVVVQATWLAPNAQMVMESPSVKESPNEQIEVISVDFWIQLLILWKY